MKTSSIGSQINYYLLAIMGFLLPLVYHTSTLDQTLVPKMIVQVILFVPMLVLWYKNKKTTQPFILYLFFGFYIYHLLSGLWALDIGEVFNNSSRTFLLFLTCFMTYQILEKKGVKKQNFYKIMSLSALACALLGWYQFFSIEEWLDANTTYIVKGNSAHRNLFVFLLYLHLPFLLLGFLSLSKKWRIPLFITLFAVVILIFSLLARGVTLGIIVTAIALGIFYSLFIQKENKFPIKKILLGLGLIIGILVGLFSFLGDADMLGRYNIFNKKYSRNIEERIVLWDNTIELIKDRPLLGYGAGNWVFHFPSKGISKIDRMRKFNSPAIRPHNDLLWIAAELGLLGLLYYSVLIFLFFKAGWHTLKNSSNTNTKWRIAILLSFILGYITISTFDFPRERIELNYLLGLMLGLILVYAKKTKSIKEISLSNTINSLLYFTLVICLAFTAYITYIRWQGEHLGYDVIVATKQNKAIIQEKAAKKMIHPLYKLDPFVNTSYFYIGNALFKQNKYREAIPHYEKGIEAFPFHLSSLYELGGVYTELKEYQKAIPYFEKALIVNDAHKQSLEGLLISYYQLKEYEKARAIAKDLNSSKKIIVQIKRELGVTPSEN